MGSSERSNISRGSQRRGGEGGDDPVYDREFDVWTGIVGSGPSRTKEGRAGGEGGGEDVY